MSESLLASLKAVVDEATFLGFVELLVADRTQAEQLPLEIDGHRGEWANQSISEFLSAAHSWAHDSQFGVRPGPKSQNPWQLFAMFLWAGRGYE